MRNWKHWMSAAATAALLVSVSSVRAQSTDYYKDKVVNIIVGGSPAGGHTRYARLLQPHLQKHLGAREVRITNVPGGGGLKAANQVMRMKPDGMNIFFGNVSTLIFAPIAGSAGAQFDPTKFTYLGRTSSEPRVLCVGGKSSIRTFQDVQKLGRPFVYPSQGTDEDFYTLSAIAEAMSFKLKAVTGYEGNADTSLAVIKGDGDGHITGSTESQAAIKSGDKRPILVIATKRIPEYPDVPTVLEIAPPAKRDLLNAVVIINETHRSYIGQPGMDPQATAAFRTALSAVMKDPAFLDEIVKKASPVSYMDGATQQKIIEDITRASAGLGPILKAAVKDIQ